MSARLEGRRWSSVFVISALALAAHNQCAAGRESPSSSVQIPAQSDWTDHGAIITATPSTWFQRLDGATTTALTKLNDTYLLYYIGASGNRADGGPAFRKLGVASCSDSSDCTSAANWTEHVGNPIITHEIPAGCDEAGIFSVAAYVDGPTVHLWYGGMEEGAECNGSVDSDGLHTTSSDGFVFTTATDNVLDHSDPDLWGNGDEIFPSDAIKINGIWYVYYIAKGGPAFWDMGVAWGSSPTSLTSSQQYYAPTPLLWKGSGIVSLGGGQWAQFFNRDQSAFEVEVRDFDASDPVNVGASLDVWDFPDFTFSSIYLDQTAGKWLMMYLDEEGGVSEGDELKLKTAPMVGGQLIFEDGFESGDSSAWSSSVP